MFSTADSDPRDGSDFILSPVANWAEKFMFFDADGVPEPAEILDPASVLSQSVFDGYLETADPAIIAALARPQTDAESAQSITPMNKAYEEGDLRRYGGVGDGSTDDSAAWQAAVTLGKVVIPKGFSFKIVTGAMKSGAVTVVGHGRSSKLICDSTVLTLTSGDGSYFDNFWMENLTAPFIITRDPSDWAADVSGTLQQSNGAGYQPTVNDADLWSGLTAGQQNQQIGPTLNLTGSDMIVSRIYGRFVRIDVKGSRNTVRDCNIRGGKGTWGAIYFDSVGITAGQWNKAVNNHVRYASFCGIVFGNNTDGLAEGNTVELCGESGVKTIQGVGFSCANMTISHNKSNRNYHDGIDSASRFPLDDTQVTSHMVIGNECYGNGGTGMNADGQRNAYIGNKFWNTTSSAFGACARAA